MRYLEPVNLRISTDLKFLKWPFHGPFQYSSFSIIEKITIQSKCYEGILLSWFFVSEKWDGNFEADDTEAEKGKNKSFHRYCVYFTSMEPQGHN